jgi:hypothetical protein
MPPLHCTKMAEILNLAAERIVSKRRRRWPQKRSKNAAKTQWDAAKKRGGVAAIEALFRR